MNEAASLRLASVPIEHILAEIAAFPLASEHAVHAPLESLQPMMNEPARQGAKGTAALWRACEGEVLHGVSGLSVDEVVAFRNRVWFGADARSPVRLSDLLTRLADQHLKVEGDTARPTIKLRVDRRGRAANEPLEVRSRRAWRWLTFALPRDLLLSSLPSGLSLPTDVRATSTPLERMLADRGFPECHMHLGAGPDFRVLWTACMLGLMHGGSAEERYFEAPGGAFDNGRLLASWLLRTAIVRCLLAAYLAEAERSDGNPDDLAHFLRQRLLPLVEDRFGITAVAELQRALRRYAAGLTPEPEHNAMLRGIYQLLAGDSAQQLQKQNDSEDGVDALGLHAFDPIACWLPPLRGGRVTPEMRFTRYGMLHPHRGEEPLHAQGAATNSHRADQWFERLFWQAVRIRCVFYRHIVQRPLTPGLQSFVRFYERIWPARRTLSKRTLIRASARSSGLGHGLRSLEIRTSVPGDWSILPELRNMEQAFKDLRTHDAEIETGVTIHFARVRGGGAESGTPNAHGLESNADPSPHIDTDHGAHQSYRFARLYMSRANEARALGRALVHFPMTLLLVRGIDTCTDEVGVPTWVIAPLFRYVRDAAGEAARTLRRFLGSAVPTIASTPHAGEDFVHLAGGMRRIDETIEFLGLQQGDRLGHGLALGIDPDSWARSVSRLELTREELLWNYLWEYRVIRRHRGMSSPSRVARLRSEIERLAGLMFEVPPSILELDTLLEDLHDERMLKATGFPYGPVPRIATREQAPGKGRLLLLQRYLTDRSIYLRGQVAESVDPSIECEDLVALQEYLLRKVASIGITIEANPTSNLLVGDLGDLKRHPLWRLQPPDRDNGSTVSVCIGSDDPVTFATRLPEEYVLLHDALVSAGVSNEGANEWIETVRRSGMDARFTLRSDLVAKLYEAQAKFLEHGEEATFLTGVPGPSRDPDIAPLP